MEQNVRCQGGNFKLYLIQKTKVRISIVKQNSKLNIISEAKEVAKLLKKNDFVLKKKGKV